MSVTFWTSHLDDFVIDNGTRLLFTSNFDGVGEHYLRDFVEKTAFQAFAA